MDGDDEMITWTADMFRRPDDTSEFEAKTHVRTKFPDRRQFVVVRARTTRTFPDSAMPACTTQKRSTPTKVRSTSA